MSLASEMEAYFEATSAPILRDSLAFKAKLGIGAKAYAALRKRENLTTISEAVGVGTLASSAAASGVVATTFFSASSSVFGSALSAIGLGAAATTPVGWVVAAGVLAGGGYFGVSRILERPKDTGLIVIPKYINTPLDTIAVALVELVLPLSLKVAHAGGCGSLERAVIVKHFANEWGYDEGFISSLAETYEKELSAVNTARLVQALIQYVKESPDCDQETVLNDFIQLLHDVIEADGIIEEKELLMMQYVTDLISVEAKSEGISGAVIKSVSVASDRITSTGKQITGRLFSKSGLK